MKKIFLRQIDQGLNKTQIFQKIRNLNSIGNHKTIIKINLTSDDILEIEQISKNLENIIISLNKRNKFKRSSLLLRKLQKIKMLDNQKLNLIYHRIVTNLKNEFLSRENYIRELIDKKDFNSSHKNILKLKNNIKYFHEIIIINLNNLVCYYNKKIEMFTIQKEKKKKLNRELELEKERVKKKKVQQEIKRKKIQLIQMEIERKRLLRLEKNRRIQREIKEKNRINKEILRKLEIENSLQIIENQRMKKDKLKRELIDKLKRELIEEQNKRQKLVSYPPKPFCRIF